MHHALPEKIHFFQARQVSSQLFEQGGTRGGGKGRRRADLQQRFCNRMVSVHACIMQGGVANVIAARMKITRGKRQGFKWLGLGRLTLGQAHTPACARA